MLAGFRIVFAAVTYRLKNLEMLNLAAGVSIALALRLEPVDLIVRTVFAFALNALVYLNNDYVDVEIDLHSSDKDNSKARFLSEHMRAALGAQLVLLALLAATAVIYNIGLLVPLIAGGGICWWYSAQLKRMPYVDIIAMFIWGVTMPLWATPMDDMLGIAMALQLGMFSSVFETIQVMRDADDDAEQEGVRTTGVVLGKRRSLILARVLMVSTTAYTALFMHPAAAAISAVALFLPFIESNIERYWTRVKLVYGISWLVICAWVFLYGEGWGLLASLRSHTAGHTH